MEFLNRFDRFDRFLAIIAAQGAEAGLGYLNQGVPHRYSAIYRFAGDMLQNVLLYDKQGEVKPAFLKAVPFEMSFCQFVLRDGCFQTSDAEQDLRLTRHPSRSVVLSYHSVPVVASTGELWGTLSHFDVVPHGLADAEFELLQAAAPVLAGYVIR